MDPGLTDGLFNKTDNSSG